MAGVMTIFPGEAETLSREAQPALPVPPLWALATCLMYTKLYIHDYTTLSHYKAQNSDTTVPCYYYTTN